MDDEQEDLFPDVTDSQGISYSDPFYDPWAD